MLRRDDGRVLRRALEFEAESKAEAKKLLSGLSKATEQCALLWASVEEGGREERRPCLEKGIGV